MWPCGMTGWQAGKGGTSSPSCACILSCVYAACACAQVGGGGTIFGSSDGGASWQKDKAADDLPSNLYKVQTFPRGPAPNPDPNLTLT